LTAGSGFLGQIVAVWSSGAIDCKRGNGNPTSFFTVFMSNSFAVKLTEHMDCVYRMCLFCSMYTVLPLDNQD
jgi:hypothetical protein